MDPNRPGITVSVLVPTYNEEEHIVGTVERLRGQEFDGKLEFLVVDGRSDDATRELLQGLARDEPQLRILDNPRRQIPAALNIGLRAARGEYVARMDAHTHYPADYIARGVERLRRGDAEWVSGPQLAFGIDDGTRRIALALSTKLGIGGASFREAKGERIVESGFTGILRRETLLAHRGWDESYLVNEDAELAARIRRSGGRIVCIPEMAARYIPRSNLRGLARQYFRYGKYRPKTSRAHPECLRRSHLLPPAVCAALAGAAMTRSTSRLGRCARAAAIAYALGLLVDTAIEARRAPLRDALAVPAVLAVMHVSWGLGFFVGIARFGLPLAAIARLAEHRPDG
jgi:glycosyltransferase involved in cell wall biosynthesis